MDWHASKNQCGVNVEEEVNEEVAKRAFESIQKRAKELRTVPDITIVSLHWGSSSTVLYSFRYILNAILMSLYDARTFVPSTTSPYGFIFTITTLPSFSFVMELEEETNYTDNILR